MIRPTCLSLLLLLTIQDKVAAQCSLCFDGSEPPDLDFVPDLFDFLPGLLSGLSCGDLLEAAGNPTADISYSDPLCEQWFVSGLVCGCPVPEGGCSLCQDGSLPPDLTFAPDELGGITCASMLYASYHFSPDPEDPEPMTCDDFSASGLICGCPVPDGGCPLCYDGSEPPDLSFAPPVFGGDLTCNLLMATAGSPSEQADAPDSCVDWLSSGLFCDCPVPPNACLLCEDGSPLPDPDKEVGLEECSFLSALATFSEGEECTAWQASSGAYCGCNNPIASEGFCRICGGDTLLPDTNIVAFQDEGEDVSCGEMELNEDGLECAVLQADYADICGCPVVGVSSDAPTTAPNGPPVAAAAADTPSTAPTDSPSAASQALVQSIFLSLAFLCVAAFL